MSETPLFEEPERKIVAPPMFFHVPKIHKAKLAAELGAHPKDFTKQRKEFEIWLKKTFNFKYGSVEPETNQKPLLHVQLSPDSMAIYDIPDGKNLFLYLKDIPPTVNEREFLIFLGLYQATFQILALEEKARILSQVGPDQEEKLAVFESQNILLPIIKLQAMPPIHLPQSIQDKLRKIPEIIETGSLRQDKNIWGKKRPGVGMLFVDNCVSRETPEHDVPYLDELLCYHDSMFFSTLLSVTRTIPGIWGLWVAAHSELLSDTNSETHKLFCAIFHIPEGKLFDEDGSIRQEAWIVSPADLHEGLVMVERRKQSEMQCKNTQEAQKQRILQTLSNPLQITCASNFVLSCQNIPAEIDTIIITIKRNDRACARTTFRPGETIIDLKKGCIFEVFSSSPKDINASWEEVSQWKGGDAYKIEVEGKIGSQEGKSQIVHSWRPEKIRKRPPPDPLIPMIGRQVNAIVTVPSQPRGKKPPVPSILPEIPKDPKEIEKQDLRESIALFLELHAADLQNILEETAVWDESSQTITLHVPDDKLIEMLYKREHLSLEEYYAATRWTSRLVGKTYIHSVDMPQEIQRVIPLIHTHIMGKQARIKIDNELSHIGFRTSEANNNHLLKKALQSNKMNYLTLSKRIQEISSHLPLNPHGPKTGYKFFKGQEINGLPQSFSLVDSGRWSATLSLPEGNFTFRAISHKIPDKDLVALTQRIENALLNFAYSCIGKKKTGLAGIVEATSLHDDKIKLQKIYQHDLQEKKARLLVEKSDGILCVIEGIGQANLLEKIQELQNIHGNESVAKLLRIDTYAFVGDTSICKPSPQQSADDYASLESPERREILRERILKTLFNGSSGVHDRSAFIHGSGVYQVLKQQITKLEGHTKKSILRENIDNIFIQDFIELLKRNNILISYRPFSAESVDDIIEFAQAEESAA